MVSIGSSVVYIELLPLRDVVINLRYLCCFLLVNIDFVLHCILSRLGNSKLNLPLNLIR
jgi:hypothetical protein